MNLRRILLIIMLIALGICAVAGMFAVFAPRADDAIGVLFSAIFVAVAFGLMIPLSLLVDKPNYRSGGIAGILVLFIALGLTLALFFIEFSRISGRWRLSEAVAMMLALTLLGGIPATGGLLLVQFRWARPAAWTFAAFDVIAMGISAIGALVIIITDNWRLGEPIIGSGFITLGLGFNAALLLVNVGCGDYRFFRWPALLLTFVGWIFAIGCIVIDPREDVWYQLLGWLIIPAVFMSHLNIVLMANLKGFQVWIRVLTIAAMAASGGFMLAAIATKTEQILLPASAAAGITAICGTVALAVLAMLNRKAAKPIPVQVAFKELKVTCPRCDLPQVVPLGGAACSRCGLELHVRVVEPRCASCDYLLYGVNLERCPECGVPIAPPNSPLPPAIPLSESPPSAEVMAPSM